MILGLNEDSLKYKIREARKIIRLALSKTSLPLIVNYSGGKDSQTLLDLVLQETNNVEALFMASSIDLPRSIEHVIDSLKDNDIHLHITFPDVDYQGDFTYWVRKFTYFPAASYTWCSSRLKLRPARAYFREIYGHEKLYKLNGVRRFESSRRKKIYSISKGFIYPDDEHPNAFIVMPLLNWTNKDVENYLTIKNITINQNYKVCGVSGCKYCPFYQPELYQQINRTYPDIYNEIIKVEKEIGKPSVIGNKFLWEILQTKPTVNHRKLGYFFRGNTP